MNEKILVIEDDKDINHMLCTILKQQGMEPNSAFNGIQGLQEALSNNYALILLDLMLPYKDGTTLLCQIREKKDTPVIILSAKDMVMTKINLLKLGADDYITKPFDIDEVVARINTVLRRVKKDFEKRTLFYRDIELDCDSKRVYCKGKEITVTAMEYAMIEILIKNPNKIFSKRNLFESASGENYISDDNTINVHISNIRKKLKAISSSDYIETVYGMGYRLKN